jgi:hypothetical protein
MARIRATFVTGMDGWVDDRLALAKPWGFDPATITVPVGVWWVTADPHVPSTHADWLLAHLPTAHGHRFDGGHVPGPDMYGQIFKWLHSGSRPPTSIG